MNTKNITEIILENLLTEGRVEDVKKRYPKPSWRSIDQLVEIDPSGNNKYLDWMAKNYLPHTIKWFKDNAGGSGYYSWTLEQVPDVSEDPRWDNEWAVNRKMSTISGSDLLRLKDDIEHFHKNPSKYEIKDINKFSSPAEFSNAVELAKQKLSRKEMKETGVDKVYEDDNFILLMPKTHKASCRYGANTQWCVTMRDRSSYFETYFSQGPIFFLIDKRRFPRTYSPRWMYDAPDYWKVAIHYKPFNGNLHKRSDMILQKAIELSEEEFVNRGSLRNSVIDYWNVRDAKTKEEVVAKFLGGPGRGQTERSTKILAKLKSVMEDYTKKTLKDYYESLGKGGYRDKLENLKKLKEEYNKLDNESDSLWYKLDRLESVSDRLEGFKYHLGSDDIDFIDWADKQIEESKKFYEQLEKKYVAIKIEKDDVMVKIDTLEADIGSIGLVFYDKEKNVSI